MRLKKNAFKQQKKSRRLSLLGLATQLAIMYGVSAGASAQLAPSDASPENALDGWVSGHYTNEAEQAVQRQTPAPSERARADWIAGANRVAADPNATGPSATVVQSKVLSAPSASEEPKGAVVDAQAAGGFLMTMEMAVREAVLTHPSLRQARGVLEQARQGVEQAEAGYYPQVRGGLVGSTRSYDNAGQRGRQTYQAEVAVSQMLYDFGKVKSDVSRARAQGQVAREKMLVAIDDLSRSAAQAWIEVHRQRALEAVAQQQLEEVSKLSELVAKRVTLGASNRSDLVQSLARVESAQVDLLTTQGQGRRWQMTLQNLTAQKQLPHITGEPLAILENACGRGVTQKGAAGAASLAASASSGLNVGVLNFEDLGALAHPASVDAVEAELDVARALVEQAKAEQKPTLSVNAQVNQGLTSNSKRIGQSGPDAVAGMNFTAPLYQGGRLQAQNRAAEYALTAAVAAVEQERLTATQNLQAAAIDWLEHSQRVKVQAQRIESLKTTRELYRQQYLQLGTRTLLDLLNAEQEYHNARSAEVDSEHQIYLQGMECLYQMGKVRETFELEDLASAATTIQDAQ